MSFGRRKAPKKDDPLATFRATRTPPDPDTVKTHEDQAAELFGGKRHTGSGASQWLKSDASSDAFQIECKQTINASLSLKLEWLKKITSEATGVGKAPALHVRFLREMQGVESDWIMLPASEVKRLLAAAARAPAEE